MIATKFSMLHLLCRSCAVVVDASSASSFEGGPATIIFYVIMIGRGMCGKAQSGEPTTYPHRQLLLRLIWGLRVSDREGVGAWTSQPTPS